MRCSLLLWNCHQLFLGDHGEEQKSVPNKGMKFSPATCKVPPRDIAISRRDTDAVDFSRNFLGATAKWRVPSLCNFSREDKPALTELKSDPSLPSSCQTKGTVHFSWTNRYVSRKWMTYLTTACTFSNCKTTLCKS